MFIAAGKYLVNSEHIICVEAIKLEDAEPVAPKIIRVELRGRRDILLAGAPMTRFLEDVKALRPPGTTILRLPQSPPEDASPDQLSDQSSSSTPA